MTDSFQNFSGTKPVAAAHKFDVGALREWLSDMMLGDFSQLTVEQFKGGQSNPTFKLITPNGNFVMRAKPGPVARLLPSAHAIEREYQVLTALRHTDIPVPKTFALCEDEFVIGRAFFIMEMVEGRVM
jgi:aminoglycoside phosphotransferase (APT) family kinase protein